MPCVPLDAQRTLQLLGSTHRASPRINSDFRADAAERTSQLQAHFCARVAPKHRPHFQRVRRVGQSHPQTSGPHLYAQRNGQLHPNHATVGQELQPCRIESAGNKTAQSSGSRALCNRQTILHARQTWRSQGDVGLIRKTRKQSSRRVRYRSPVKAMEYPTRPCKRTHRCSDVGRRQLRVTGRRFERVRRSNASVAIENVLSTRRPHADERLPRCQNSRGLM